MGRARGANALMALAFASSYGAVPNSGYRKMAFTNEDLGEEQGLVASNLLGYGRAPLAPDKDVINNRGTLGVPVDQRLIGVWLKLLLGAPATTQGVAATGSIVFAANPLANATITIAGQAFTFKASAASATDITIGATLAESVRNAVRVLNASAVAAVAAASYSTDATASTIFVTHDTIGTSGNAFTIAASLATPSGATLAGGSASGPYNHVYQSGSLALPDAAIEVGMPDVPTFAMNNGIMIGGITIPLTRSGNLDATLTYIAQGELPRTTTTAAGTPSVVVVDRFSQFTGLIMDRGVPLAGIVSGQFAFDNGLDPVENIRGDGKIDGADPGEMSLSPQYVARFADLSNMDLATSGLAVDMTFGWNAGVGKSLTFRQHAVRLPKVKAPITAPGGVQTTFTGMGHQDAGGKFLTATLVNDVANYD